MKKEPKDCFDMAMPDKKERLTQCPLYIGIEIKHAPTEKGMTCGMCLKEECELWEDQCLIRTALKKFTEVMGIIALGVRMYMKAMEKW